MSFDNILAILAFLSLIVVFYFNYKKAPRDNSATIVTLVGLAIFIVTVLKNCQNEQMSIVAIKRNDSLQHKVDLVKRDLSVTIDTCTSNGKKLDTLNLYIRRLDSLGIKRNPITNMPIKNAIFIKYVNRMTVE